MCDRRGLAVAVLAGLAVLALPDAGWPLSGPGPRPIPNCVGARIEHVEDLTQGVQKVERVRLVIFCTTDRWYQLVRAWAMRVDGTLGQLFSSDREMLCEIPRPEPEVRATADVLREGR